MLASDLNTVGVSTVPYPDLVDVTPDAYSSPILAALAREEAAA